jgi:hypothetical protein
VAYIVVGVDVFVVMKYSVIQMVFIVETYVRKKSYKKCHSRFIYQFLGVLILFKINVHKNPGFFNWYCEAEGYSGQIVTAFF